jgi:hypothetical protein
MSDRKVRKARLRLPDFIGIGPGRTGTTWLHQTLLGHTGLPLIKETNFFKSHYEKGLDWYAIHFAHCPQDLPIGEISPTYFNCMAARERIAKDLPNCRIICCLRDPVDRTYSHYRQMRPLWGTQESFEEALQNRPEMTDASNYAVHLEAWQMSFGRKNVLVLYYDDLKSKPQEYINSACSFIGIPMIDLKTSAAGTSIVNHMEASRAPRSRRLALAAGMTVTWLRTRRFDNVLHLFRRSGLLQLCVGGGEEYAPLSAETEKRLREQFRPDIEKLEALTSRDLSTWKEGVLVAQKAGV